MKAKLKFYLNIYLILSQIIFTLAEENICRELKYELDSLKYRFNQLNAELRGIS